MQPAVKLAASSTPGLLCNEEAYIKYGDSNANIVSDIRPLGKLLRHCNTFDQQIKNVLNRFKAHA